MPVIIYIILLDIVNLIILLKKSIVNLILREHSATADADNTNEKNNSNNSNKSI